MKKKIVVIGSCNTDMVIKSERLPAPGETILGGAFTMHAGGKGANQAVAAARLGGWVDFVCKTGRDDFGKRSKELYSRESIDTEFVFDDEREPSGVALITVDERGENCIVVASGANSALDEKDIDLAGEAWENAGILLMQLEIPMKTVCYAAKKAKASGLTVILNPAPARDISEELLRRIDILIPNKSEAELLSGVKISDWPSAGRAAEVLAGKGIGTVVLTLGSMGALVRSGQTVTRIPVERVEAVDTTGAGDTFCGAFCVGLSEGMPVEESVEFANRAAGLSVTRMGAQSSIPYRREMPEIRQSLPGMNQNNT